jgi:hypothetical protein
LSFFERFGFCAFQRRFFLSIFRGGDAICNLVASSEGIDEK